MGVQNVSKVNPTGFTALRLHISGGRRPHRDFDGLEALGRIQALPGHQLSPT